MTVQVDVIQHGAAKAAYDLRMLGFRAAEPGPAWAEMNLVFHADEERRFALQGPGWAPLADETVARKGNSRILVDTGTLKRSLTTGATGRVSQSGERLLFGTDDEVARFHQFGTVNMPRREVVGLSETAQRRMVAVLERWIVHGAGL